MVLKDTLASSLTYSAVLGPAGACTFNATTRLLQCNLSTLAAGASAMVRIQVIPTTSGFVVGNTVTASAATTDRTPSNNTAMVLTAVAPGAGLKVTVTDAPDPVRSGTSVIYTVKVTNSGPNPAANVVLKDTLSSLVSFSFFETTGAAATT